MGGAGAKSQLRAKHQLTYEYESLYTYKLTLDRYAVGRGVYTRTMLPVIPALSEAFRL